MKNFKKLTMYDESIETTASNSTAPLLGLDNVISWVAVEKGLPNEFTYFDPTKVESNRECGLHI
jgi:hypothetical protein